MIKQKFLALICALALCISATSCTIASPTTVGTIGDVEITSGMYLLSQFQGYQTALSYANSEQTALSTSKFLKETVYVPDETTGNEPATKDTTTDNEGDTTTEGTPRLVSEIIAEETLKNLNFYAAIEHKFTELGGELSESELATAKSYAKQIWDGNGDLYAANGIGLASLEAFQIVSTKNTALLELVYGKGGAEEVAESELSKFLETEMVYAAFVNVPTYNTTDYTFADETQTAEMIASLEATVRDYKDATAESDNDAESACDAFVAALESHIVDAYAVMGTEYDPANLSSEVYTQLFGQEALTGSFSDEILSTVNGLSYNEATAFNTNQMSIMALLRLDPLSNATLDDLRASILNEMKFYDLVDSLNAEGSALVHTLDETAMRKLPATKIVGSVK